MILTVVLTVFATVSALLAATLLVFFYAKRRFQSFIHQYITAPDENTPSQLGLFVDTLACLFAQRLVTQLKSTVMGMNSVDARIERKQASEAVVQGSPALAAMLNFIPGARRLMKSPEVLAAAAQILGKVGGGNGSKAVDAPELKSGRYFNL